MRSHGHLVNNARRSTHSRANACTAVGAWGASPTTRSERRVSRNARYTSDGMLVGGALQATTAVRTDL